MTATIVTFDTTHHALWAEEIAIERSLGIQVVPAPAAARAKCDLALEVLPEDLDALVAALTANGVAFRLFEAAASAEPGPRRSRITRRLPDEAEQ